VPRVALVAAPAIVDRLRIVAVADVCPAADRACVNFHHVPLVAAACPSDLLLRAKLLFVAAMWCGTNLASRGLEDGFRMRKSEGIGRWAIFSSGWVSERRRKALDRKGSSPVGLGYFVPDGTLLALLIAVGAFILLVSRQ
jgi:hypothetical protein